MLKAFFCGETQTSESPAEREIRLLREQAAQVRQEICMAEDAFNLLDDDLLVDALSYRIKALNLYYDYLLQLARRQGEAAGQQMQMERIGEMMG